MKTEKCCGNCKHLKRHYVICSGKFHPIDWGHCAENLRRYKKLYKTDCAACEKWEQCESVFKQNNLEYYLSEALKNICSIAEILDVINKDA